MTRVTFHVEAEAELVAAAANYERQRADLGLEFIAEVERATRALVVYPKIGHRFSRRLRRVLVRRFPYGLLYRIDPDKGWYDAVNPKALGLYSDAEVSWDMWDDDYFYKNQVHERLSQLTAAEWSELEQSSLTFSQVIQERLAVALGGHPEDVPRARILLRLAGSHDREVSLTARAELRDLRFPTVQRAAVSAGALEPSLQSVIAGCSSINEILDAIEREVSRRGGPHGPALD